MKPNKRSLFIFLIFSLNISLFAEGWRKIYHIELKKEGANIYDMSTKHAERLEKYDYTIYWAAKLSKNQNALLWDAIELYFTLSAMITKWVSAILLYLMILNHSAFWICDCR